MFSKLYVYIVCMAMIIGCHSGRPSSSKTFTDIPDFKKAVLIELKIDRRGDMNIDQCIYLVKMFNSVFYYGLVDSLGKKYTSAFTERYQDTILKKLEFQDGGNFCYISKKYNLGLGSRCLTKKSLFKIEKLPHLYEIFYDSLAE